MARVFHTSTCPTCDSHESIINWSGSSLPTHISGGEVVEPEGKEELLCAVCFTLIPEDCIHYIEVQEADEEEIPF